MPARAISAASKFASSVPPRTRARVMADPWLTIIGIGEDGLAGLSEASRKALAAAITGRGHPWPVPFDVDSVLSCRGRPTVVLASGDPFWHGVGGSLAAKLRA